MRKGITAPGPAGPGARPALLAALVVGVLLAAGCGQQHGPSAAGPPDPAAAAPSIAPSVTPSIAPSAGPSAAPSAVMSAAPSGGVSMSPTDRTACADLVGRLAQVTQTIGAGSELLTNSLDKQELSQRIADETTRLRQAAELMARGPVPPRLAAADRDLVAALNAFADDFNRAAGAANRGDLSAAAGAMNDEATVNRIVDASDTIEETCA